MRSFRGILINMVDIDGVTKKHMPVGSKVHDLLVACISHFGHIQRQFGHSVRISNLQSLAQKSEGLLNPGQMIGVRNFKLAVIPYSLTRKKRREKHTRSDNGSSEVINY